MNNLQKYYKHIEIQEEFQKSEQDLMKKLINIKHIIASVIGKSIGKHSYDEFISFLSKSEKHKQEYLGLLHLSETTSKNLLTFKKSKIIYSKKHSWSTSVAKRTDYEIPLFWLSLSDRDIAKRTRQMIKEVKDSEKKRCKREILANSEKEISQLRRTIKESEKKIDYLKTLKDQSWIDLDKEIEKQKLEKERTA